MLYEPVNDWMDGWCVCHIHTHTQCWYPRYEYVNTDIFSWGLEGVTFSSSWAEAWPHHGHQQHLQASRVNRHVQLHTHGPFIHLLLVLNAAPEVWTSQRGVSCMLLICGDRLTLWDIKWRTSCLWCDCGNIWHAAWKEAQVSCCLDSGRGLNPPLWEKHTHMFPSAHEG